MAEPPASWPVRRWWALTRTMPATRSTARWSPTRPGAEPCSSAWWAWASRPFCRPESLCCRGRWRCSAICCTTSPTLLTAVPLLVAFTLARRPPNKRYTYGYGRAEDLGGLFVIAMIALSSVLAAYQAIDRLLHPQQVSYVWAVAIAGVVGFLG